MNFNAVRAAPGSFVTMPAIPTGIEIKQGSFGPYAFAVLTDDNGESRKILIGSNDKSPLIQPGANGQRSKFGVKYDMNSQKYKAYFNGVLHGQQPASPSRQVSTQPNKYNPPQEQQLTQQPAGRDTGLSIERQACFKAACERFKGTDAYDSKVIDLAVLGAYFVATGKTHASGNDDGFLDKTIGDQIIDHSATNEQAEAPTDDDIPF